MDKNRLRNSAIFLSAVLAASCAPHSITASPPPFEKNTLLGEGWKAERTSVNEYTFTDERGGLITASSRQEFLSRVLVDMQNVRDCQIEEEKIVTNGSRRVVFENPECLE